MITLLKKSLVYLFLYLLPVYLVVTFLWSFIINDNLYHQTDNLIFFIDFIPFIGRHGFVEQQYGETYAAWVSPTLLYSLWSIVSVLIIIISLFFFQRRKHHNK
jgi:hypothetical protein